MELFGVDILKILTIDLIHVFTIGVLGGLLLHYATGYLYFLNRSYKKVITVMIIGCSLFFIFDLIPVFGVGLGHLGFWFLIKVIYNEPWDQALGAWFLSIFIAFMISLLILLIFGIEIIFMPNLLT
jgi:hypothetical protein